MENIQVEETQTEQTKATVLSRGSKAKHRRPKKTSLIIGSIITAVVAFLVIAAAVFLLPNIGGNGLSDSDTAATVNGTKISESEATAKIEALRSGYDNDDAWAAALGQAGFTPETLREEIIRGLAEEALVLQHAEDNEIEVAEEDVEKVFNTSKDSFEDEQVWMEYLASNGFPSDEEYKEEIRFGLIKEQVVAKLGEEEKDKTEADDKQNEEEIDTNSYDDLVSGLMANADLKINPMPNGLPYDVGKKVDKSE